MEPLTTTIVTALALGASAALKETVPRIVNDAYEGLKGLLRRKYASVSVELLEQDPSSEKRKSVVEEDLAKAGADRDVEVLRQAKELLETVSRETPEVSSVVGVDLQDIKGKALRISGVLASGPGVRVKHAEMSQDIEISGVRAGMREGDPSKKS